MIESSSSEDEAPIILEDDSLDDVKTENIFVICPEEYFRQDPWVKCRYLSCDMCNATAQTFCSKAAVPNGRSAVLFLLGGSSFSHYIVSALVIGTRLLKPLLLLIPLNTSQMCK